jgi:cytochrome P450
MSEQTQSHPETVALSDRELIDFDHTIPVTSGPPWERYTDLRERDDVPYSEAHGGFLVVSRYEDVCAVSRDPSLFLSGAPQNTIPSLPSDPLPPLHSDPPDHRVYRDIVNPFFSPSRIREYEPWIREYVIGYVDRLLASEGWDVPLDLGQPLTRDVTFRIMGIVDPPLNIRQAADLLVYGGSPEASEALMGYLGDELSRRRTEPGDDLISGLSIARFGDRPLEDNEIVRLCLILLLAGLETTATTIAGSVWYLLEHREVAVALSQANDAQWRLAIEEFIRFAGPVQALARTAGQSTDIRGHRVDRDERILMLLASANRDETEFDRPDEFVIDRHPNRHVSFGMGPHRCVGSHLSKVELQLVLERLVGRLDDWELAPGSGAEWVTSQAHCGIRSLPVRRRTS